MYKFLEFFASIEGIRNELLCEIDVVGLVQLTHDKLQGKSYIRLRTDVLANYKFFKKIKTPYIRNNKTTVATILSSQIAAL